MQITLFRFSSSHRFFAALFLALGLIYGGSAHQLSSSSDSSLLDVGSVSKRDQEETLERTREREEEELDRYDKPAEAQEYYLLKRLPAGTTSLPVEKYLKALKQIKRMPQYSTAWNISLPARQDSHLFAFQTASPTLGTWQPLGPGNIGGRTRAILIDPSEPNTMYAAGVAGGIWKTTDGGQAWTPLTDMMANLAVNSMAMAPNDSNVIYAGTGEGYFNSDAVRGAGIFKTEDGGDRWVHLASTNTEAFHFVNDIVVSPTNPQRLYAGTQTGVWRSLDGGVSWAQVLNPNLRGGCLDLAIRTDQATDFVFASCGTFVQSTVYRNTEAESNRPWSPVLSDPGMGRVTLAIAPSDQNIVYAVAASIVNGTYRNGLHAAFQSSSAGEPGTWTAQVRNTDSTKLNTVLLSNTIFAFATQCGFGSDQFLNQGWYDLAVAVDPVDPFRLWVGGIDLFRSDDGGMSWGQASHWWADDGNSHYVHADQHVIVFHPQYNGTTNQIMFVGNDGGIFRTNNALAPVATGPGAPCNTDNGDVLWVNLNNNYGVTQFYHGVPFLDGLTYFGGTQDNGTLLGKDQLGVNGWRQIMGADGGYVAVDPTDTNVLYAETQGGNIRKSLDGGLSFFSATGGLVDNNLLFITPFIMDPGNPQRLWTGGQFVWRTDNGAASWVRASSSIRPGRSSISAIGLAPTNPSRVLAGVADGYIMRTDVGLTATENTVWTWTRPRNGFVSSITFDPLNANIAYATYSTFGDKHVWKSTDGGANWAAIDGMGDAGIPDIPVHSLVVDPHDPLRLYVGTDLGVFVSTDGGQTWAVENTGFANVITEALAVTDVNGVITLFAFTHGRGAWRVVVNDDDGGIIVVP